MSTFRESPSSPSEGTDAADQEKDTSTASIPLAPLTSDAPTSSSVDLRAEAMRLDVVLAFLVLVFAGLLAAFPVRNSDFWMHLATGRRILAGEANFGVDPYSFTTAGVYWANTSWGYDVFFYTLTRLAGGAEEALAGYLVVGTKALLIAILALIMMLTRRRTGSLWAPAMCTMLALLAWSWRLTLQPALFSAIFLALTIFILQRPRHLDNSGPAAASSRIHWLLPVLFMVWANVDEWFILGPATVALFLVGQLLQKFFSPLRTGVDAPEPGQLGKLALLLIVGLTACLANPFLLHAFVIPSQLSPNIPTELIRADRYLRSFPVSIFDTSAFARNAGDVSMIATYLLALLGVVSFVLTFNHGWRWWRLVIWGAFFFLGAYQARLGVFFAVAAAPITALNLQDFAQAQFGVGGRSGALWKIWSIGGRLVSCLACLVLMLLTWPGWLHGGSADGRYLHKVALKLEPDESVSAAAQQLADWQKSGKIPADARIFNWTPDLPGYFAWYQPDSAIGKGFLDYRFSLFPKSVFKDYLDIRRVLGESSERGAISSDLNELLHKHKIQFVALNWADPIGTELLLAIKDWTQWKLLFMQGTTAIIQRLEPGDSGAPKVPPRLDPNLTAFSSTTILAPSVGPGRGPRLADPWQVYADGPPARPPQTLSLLEYLIYYEGLRKYWPWPYIVATETATWSTLAAASACSPMVATGGAPLTLFLSSMRTLAVFAGMAPPEMFTQGKEGGPPGALLLAIRYARQAIAAEPDHFQAYSHLASAYNYISRGQEDRWAPISPNQPPLARQSLRRVQITTVLEQVLKVRPEDLEAHRLLLEIYGQINCLDLAQEHLRHVAAGVAGMGPENGESMEAYRSRVEKMQTQLQQFDADITKRRNAFELAAQNRPLFEKAQIALSHGLGQHALEMMMESDLSSASEAEVKFVLELLLSQGRVEELEQVLREEFRRYLGMSYDWYKAQAGAALGNYDEAYDALVKAAEQIEDMVIEKALETAVSQTIHGDNLNNVNTQRTHGRIAAATGGFSHARRHDRPGAGEHRPSTQQLRKGPGNRRQGRFLFREQAHRCALPAVFG